MESYTLQLKNRYDCIDFPRSQWPLFTPTKYTNLGFISHKPKGTSGAFSSEDSFFDNILDIFLPITDNKRPQIILIEGAPGIGKTVLMKEIEYLWAKGKILSEKRVLLYFSLRHPKINEMNAIDDMFYFSCENRENATTYANYFLSNSGQGLVLLLDGLDENPQAMRMQSGIFFYDILKIFIDACIVITSRPHATTKLQQYISYRVEIIGFTDQRRREFVQENVKENADDLLNYFKEHERIDTLCYIPLNMSIIVSSLREGVKIKNLPATQTELTKQAVKMTVFHELEKLGMTKIKNDLKDLPKPYDEIFYCLSALAYNAMIDNKLTFTSDEISKACPVLANGDKDIKGAIINGLGLLNTIRFCTGIGGDTESLSNFAHYTVQELLAAWYIAFSHRSWFKKLPLTCNIQKSMQKCLQFWCQRNKLNVNFWNGDFINMWSFYIGLTGGEDFAFKHFLSEKMLCSYMQCEMLYFHQKPTNREHVNAAQCTISRNILDDKIKRLLLYFVLQEAHNNVIIERLDSLVTQQTLNVSGEPLYEKNLYLLGYILSRPYLTKQWKIVDISHCGIDDEKFKILHEVLTRNDGRPKPDIEALFLSGNKLKSCSDAIVDLVCRQKIAHLHVFKNSLTKLVSFENCGEILRTLDISNNELGNEEALDLFISLKFLRRLNVLKLNHIGISYEQGVTDAIGLALCYCNSLEELELDGNSAEFVDEAMLLFQTIKKIKSSNLNVHNYSFTNEVYAFIKILKYCDQIEYYPDSCLVKDKIRKSNIVNVSCNGLKAVYGHYLGQHLHLLVNLKTLDISENNISDKATKSLATGMLLTPKLKKFIYDKNLFSEDSTMIFEVIRQLHQTTNKTVFKCAPSKVKALVFTLNCINDNEEKLQSSDIVSTIKRITELNLSHNEPTPLDYKLTSEDLKELCTVLRWFKQLKVLDVKNNNITNEARKSLTKIMLQFSTLNTCSLTLHGNPIFDDKLSMAIFYTIENIRKKKIRSIIHDHKSSNIKCQYILYIMDCLNQLENPDCFISFDSITTVDTDSESKYGAKILECLKFLPCLRYLRINNVKCVTDCGINQLSKYLSHNRTLTTLDLSFCDLCNLEVENVPSNKFPLQTLKFNYSNVTDKVLHNLSLNMLKFANLNQLELEGNNFGDKKISSMYNVLLSCENDQLRTTITSLNLANNQLTENSALEIIEIVQICKVKYLNISLNDLGTIFPHFKQNTITTLEELNISSNSLKANALCLGQCLHLLVNLRILDISKNDISDEATKSLTTGILLTPNLEEFKYDENLFSSESTMIFKMIHRLRISSNTKLFKCAPLKLKALVFILNCINDNEEKLQSSDIVSTISHITELNLSHNEPTTLDYKLTSEDLNELCAVLRWFKQLKVLDVRNNNITDETRKLLTKALLQFSTLNTCSLKLHGNPIFDDKLSMAIFDNIENIRKKKIRSIIQDRKSSSIECQCILYIMDCLNQLENPDCFISFENVTTVDTDSESKYGIKILEYLKFLPFLRDLKINHVTCITDCGINQLSKYLSYNRTLTTLDLSFCDLCNLEVENGPSNIFPLQTVKFNHSNITDRVLFKLSLNMLMFTNLNQLELEGNHFGDKGISGMYNALMSCENDQLSTTITSLNLADNQLTQCSTVKIIEIVQVYNVKCLNISKNHLGRTFPHFKHSTITTLEELNISSNGLKANAVCLGQCLHFLVNLRTFDISKNDISDKATKSLTTGMLLTPSLEEFKYDENLFSEDSAMIFKMIYQLRNTSNAKLVKCTPLEVKALVFILNCINDNEEKLQSSDIVSTISHITELNLSHNEPTTLDYKLTSEDLNELCAVLRWFKQLKVLDVRNNNITNETRKSLAKIMLQFSTLNACSLKLCGNPIFDDKLSMAIFYTIENMRKKKIRSIIHDHKSSSIECQCILYIMDCLNQLENPNCFKSFESITTVDTDSEAKYGAKILEYFKFLPFLKDLKINHVTCITDCGINQLSKYLSHNRTLTTLDLSYCDLCNLEVENEPSNISPLQTLKFNYSNITDKILFKLSLNMLKFTYLDQLELEGNHFGDKGISSMYNALMSCENDQLITTITSLNLANNQLTSNSEVKIIEIVQIYKVKCLNISKNHLESIFPHFEHNTMTTLEELNISSNSLKANAVCLGQHLHLLVNLKILDISKNDISDEATKSLTTGILLTPNLEEFKYDENLFSKDSTVIFKMIHQLRSTSNAKIFKCTPSEVKALVFILNCINDNEEKLQSSDIVSTISHITELNLSQNEPTTQDYKLTSEDLNELCAVLRWFKQLKVLDVRNNYITDEARKSLAKIMLQFSTLNTCNLKLHGNPIFDDKFSMAIFYTIEDMRKKKIRSIIDDYNSSSIECQCILYIMDCLSQLENPDCLISFESITTVDTNSESKYGAKLLEYLKFLPFLKDLKINHVTCITDCGIHQLSKYLSHNRTLTTLNLSFCDLCNLEVENGPSNIFLLQKLKFNYSNITDRVLFKLSLNILKFTNLDHLELEGNHFGDKGVSSMYNALMSCENDRLRTTITSLNLANNQITQCSTVEIIEIVQIYNVKCLNISKNHFRSIFPHFEQNTITTLEELNISSNGLKANAVCIGQHLHLLVNLRILDISKNDISDEATKSLTAGILLTPSLEEFRYDENLFSEDSIMTFKMIYQLHNTSNTKIFKCTPSEAKALVFILNCINDNEEKLQSSDIVSTISHITELNLSHNDPTTLDYKLTSEDLNELCAVLRWFKQLKVLDVRNNNITDEARESVTKIMLQISTLNSYSLKLYGNPIFDDIFSMAVLRTIKNLCEKQIQTIIYDHKNSCIEFQYIMFIMDCLNQLENPDFFISFESITTVDTGSESEYGTKFLEYLNFLPFLSNLMINHVKCITDCGISRLSKCLSHNRTLTILDLSFCDLCNLEVENGPSNSFPLQALKFNHCNITDEVLFKLSLNMLKFTNLNQLELEGNHFGDKGIYSMHDALLSCENDQLCATITSLNLANNQLTACSAVKIIEIVKVCKVKCLNISKNDLGIIFTHFEQCTITTLEELNISANNHHNAKQFAIDISYLKSCSSLRKLDISGNNIDETALDEISSFFIVCSHLEEVLYKDNPAYNEIELAFHLVQDLCNKKSCVKSINFNKKPRTALTLISQISPQCNSKFAKSVKLQLNHVSKIDFSCNYMEIDENFICLLEICTQLEDLNLKGNNITNDTFKYLVTGILFTNKLKRQNLHVKENPFMVNRKNIFVLEIIETLRWKTEDYFNCHPAMFESFLTVLECVDSISCKQNDIIKRISLIKRVNLNYSEQSSDSFDQHLKNTNQKLQSRDIKNFCKYFKYFKSLRSMHMIGNNITEDVKDDLAIAVLKNHNVIEIQLVGNPVHQSKCSKFFDAIGRVRTSRKWPKTEIMHSSNPFVYPFTYHAEVLEAVVNMLKYIKDFDDKTCDITENREELDISHYPQRSIEKVDNPVEMTTDLIHHLKLFSRLKMLNLSSSFLTLDALQELSEYLHNNDTLLKLDISQNDIQATGALIVLRSLDKTTTLRRLNMEENNITGKESVEIATIICSFLKLRVDILKGNKLNEESRKMLKSK